MAKYNIGTYKIGYLCGGFFIDVNLVTFKHEFFIPLILQIYVLYWYHIYLLIPLMDIMEATILHHLYCPGIIKSVQKEVKIVTHSKVQNGQI